MQCGNHNGRTTVVERVGRAVGTHLSPCCHFWFMATVSRIFETHCRGDMESLIFSFLIFF